ncbi:hypothetical protein BMF94_0482 [Rhodotorula taiwanensis]|uniref:COX assembly mitochondrial protein n=1 Tax=Rhodotorula taiwanensis TaxID=741276 RepID=A0A2S5BHP4_9BASI|nr:hypothetical protein BMF94_0482 [Rhodotorula taiwanensis]
MKALQQCHAQYPYLKFVGACNDQKHALNACLRQERLERTRKNSDAAREKRRAVEERWKEIDAES